MNTDFMSLHDAIVTFKFHSSCGFHVLDHLAADGAGLTGGQVTVVTVGQVYANLPWCLFYIVNYSDDGVRQAVDCQEQTP